MPHFLLEDLRRVSKKVLQVYGPTETTIWSTVADLTYAVIVLILGSPYQELMCSFWINKKPSLIGSTGEIYIGGSGVSQGYHNRDEITEKSFIKNHSILLTSILYKTGDIAKFNSSGKFM